MRNGSIATQVTSVVSGPRLYVVRWMQTRWWYVAKYVMLVGALKGAGKETSWV